MANEVRTFTLNDDPGQVIEDLNAAFDGTTQTGLKAESANTAVNVTTNINGHAITDIFEVDGTTVKQATHAASADSVDVWSTMPPLTYVDGQSATATGDYTDTIQKGDKFWCEQTINKYAFIIGVSYNIGTGLTTFTFSPFGDSEGAVTTLVSAPINNPYYSKIENPQGFPKWINYNPTYGGGGSMTYDTVNTLVAKFTLDKNICRVMLSTVGITVGTANPQITVSLPVSSLYTDSRFTGPSAGRGQSSYVSGFYQISAPDIVSFYIYNAGNWTVGTGIGVSGVIDYIYTSGLDETGDYGVVMGDSIAEGHPGLHGRLHPGSAAFDNDYYNNTGQLSFDLAPLFGKYFFNHGIGSQTTTDIWNRWQRDVLGQEYDPSDGRGNRTIMAKPRMVVVSAGVNDVSTGVALTTIQNNLINMAQSALNNNIEIVFLNVGPFNAADAAMLTKIDQINAFMTGELLTHNPNAIVVDYHTFIKDPANPGKVNPALTAGDGTHPSKDGYHQLAQVIYDTYLASSMINNL